MMDNYQNNQSQIIQPKQRSKLITFLLCYFLGGWGIHRFYVGKVWTGILYLFTGGLCGVGTLIDVIRILCNAFLDKQRYPLKNDLPTWVILLLLVIWIVLICSLCTFFFMTGFFEGLLG